MQKTSNGKKTFLSTVMIHPNQTFAKNLQKAHLISQRSPTEPNQDNDPHKKVQKPIRNRNFQYYFYDKYNSTKNLNKLRNSSSTKNLLEKEKLKSARLNHELDQMQKDIIEGKLMQSSDVPFYMKYRSQPIQNDPKLADYGQFYSRKNIIKQTSPSHRFQKLKQNKQNVYKYRETRGMVSPSKKSVENVCTQRQIDVSPKYNQSLSPFEFKNTIEGRILTKSSKNLCMDLNKTHKINNVNQILYNNSSEVEREKEEFLKIRKSVQQFAFNFRFEEKIKKCHSFDSYKGHKLFESRLKKIESKANEKFYNPYGNAKNMSVYQRWKTHNHIDMTKTTNRPKLPQKPGTNLEYQIPVKTPSKNYRMGVSSSERNLVFTKQVIIPIFGFYR